jgi:hypothetical protein
MAERRFKYAEPKNTDERIEAIYEEFRSTSRQINTTEVDTIKDHLAALLSALRKNEFTRELERESETHSMSHALGILGFISLLLLLTGYRGSEDIEWIQHNQFTLLLWGIACGAVFVGVSIERSSLIRLIWSFGFTKIAASLAVSALLIFASGKASALINNVFGVDASALPYTRAYMTGLLTFQYVSPLLALIAFFALFHALDAIGYIKSYFFGNAKYQLPPWNSFAFLIITVSVLLFSWHWLYKDFSPTALPAKVYRLAHMLDFNARHTCSNLPPSVNVIYLGLDHGRVLIDPISVETNSIQSFIDSTMSDIKIPNSFAVHTCTPAPYPDTEK